MTDQQNRYLSGDYAAQNPSYHVEDSAWKARQILGLLHKHGQQPKTVCEVGCGAGEVLRQLQGQLPAETLLSGYEVSPQAFALAASRANERLRFSCADFLTETTDPYDLVLCVDVFEHVEDYLGFLRKLRTRGMYTLFHIPLDMSAQAVWRVGTIVENRRRVGHLHYFCKETALMTLEESGYEIVDWTYTASGIDRAKTFGAKIAALPRRIAALFSRDFAARVLGGYSLLVLAKQKP